MNSFNDIIRNQWAFMLKKWLLLLVCIALLAQYSEASKRKNVVSSITINNPSGLVRHKEIISINRKELETGKDHLFPLVQMNRKALISQITDTNNDDVWDVLLVEVSLAAYATEILQISWTIIPSAAAKLSTNVRLSLRSGTDKPFAEINDTVRYRGFKQNTARPFYQMEGPGIENDKVAFRSFFDYRNGKDIFGKITPEMVLEKVGVGVSWHNLQSWGMDILKVGNSLGAGAIAVKEKDDIYRIADADTSSFKVLYKGPLQAAFKLDFKNWDVAKSKMNGRETILMSKGDFFYKNEIELKLRNRQQLISGIANFIGAPLMVKHYPGGFSSIATYGKQAEGTATNLGLAIMCSSASYVTSATTDSASNIPNTSYVALKAKDTTTIYFFACWQQTDTRFSSIAGFQDYLEQTAARLANPIQILINRKK